MAGLATRVLIVDDSAAMRTVLREVLAHEGYQVVGELASGLQLMAELARLQPHVVCLDYHLPGSDGLQLLYQIGVRHPAVAVIMVTGSQDGALDVAAAQAGAAGFLRKPLSPNAIVREVALVAHAQAQLQAAGEWRHAPADGAAPASAVIADDSGTMRQLLVAILESMAVKVLGQAQNGRQAVDMVAAYQPALACLDLDMPCLDGLAALQQIKHAAPHTKVLIISGRSSRAAIVQAAQAGADGYILKPFQPAKVVEAVRKCGAVAAV